MSSPVSTKISAAMVSESLQVLRESGLLFHEGSGDYLVVQQMLKVALNVQAKAHARSEARRLKRGIQGVQPQYHG